MKTFYKKKATNKIFFTPNIRYKSYAYGDAVHNNFISWRKEYLDSWNSPRSVFYIQENGSIDGNSAKINKVGEFGIATLSKTQKGLTKKTGKMTPLWLDGFCFEVGSYGEFIVNGVETDYILINLPKAWGIDVAFTQKGNEYTLFVYGNNDKGSSELRAYKLVIDRTVTLSLICSRICETTLSRKSALYCMGSHIFLVSESKLSYFYYNAALTTLEEVAIDTDEPNADKSFCCNVDSSIVCDANGCIFWKSGNQVYFFPIGYPRRLRSIDLGEGYDIIRIQTFRDVLYLYGKSKITKECVCVCYTISAGEIRDSKVFNYDSKYNLFYADKNGILYYLKFHPTSRLAYVTRTTTKGEESIGEEIDLFGVDQVFCVNGDLYCNYDYVCNVQ